MCRSSGNHIQWRISLFDTVPVNDNKNKSLLCHKFGSVYARIFAAVFNWSQSRFQHGIHVPFEHGFLAKIRRRDVTSLCSKAVFRDFTLLLLLVNSCENSDQPYFVSVFEHSLDHSDHFCLVFKHLPRVPSNV